MDIRDELPNNIRGENKDGENGQASTRVGTLIVATIYLQLIQNRYKFRSFTVLNVVTSIVYNPLPAMWKS